MDINIYYLVSGLIAATLTLTWLYVKTRVSENAKSAELRETNRQLEDLKFKSAKDLEEVRSKYAKELEDVKAKSTRELEDVKSKSARELEELRKDHQLEIKSVQNKYDFKKGFYEFKKENYVKFISLLNEILYRKNKGLDHIFNKEWFERFFDAFEIGDNEARSKMVSELGDGMSILLTEANRNFKDLINESRTIELVASKAVEEKIISLNLTYKKINDLADEFYKGMPLYKLFEKIVVEEEFSKNLNEYNNSIDNTIKDLIKIMKNELAEI